MEKTASKEMICRVLMEEVQKGDKTIVALCSDSRGSGSFSPFAQAFPGQFVETGIAEQDLVSIAAGLARCGKKSYAVSPACPGYCLYVCYSQYAGVFAQRLSADGEADPCTSSG